MFKTLMISAAISALMVSGALAQADKPADSGKFIASQSTDQWVFSNKPPSRTSGGGGPTTGMGPRPTAPTAPPAGR